MRKIKRNVNKVLKEGVNLSTRTPTGTLSILLLRSTLGVDFHARVSLLNAENLFFNFFQSFFNGDMLSLPYANRIIEIFTLQFRMLCYAVCLLLQYIRAL